MDDSKPLATLNPSFSTKLPQLQLAIDNTSLSEFKICPRKYFLSIILGRQPATEAVPLTFGLLMHKALELYHHIRLQKQQIYHHPDKIHEEALREVVHWALRETWDKSLNKPWISNDRNRNRFTLIRSIIWYLDEYQYDNLETIILGNGKPAVELSFIFFSGYKSNITGEPFNLCGHLDRLVAFEGDYYVTDVKTTASTLSQYYFKKYSPDNQFSMYSLAALEGYRTPTAGVIVDACQIAVEFTKFERGWIGRSQEQLSDWRDDLGYWLTQMEDCAAREYWPKNDTACDRYGGCPFRPVCSQPSKGAAQEVLEGTYRTRQWNPLQKRGDI